GGSRVPHRVGQGLGAGGGVRVLRPVGHVGAFFLQAEDGIRDGHVTGVQTCALPIFGPVPDGVGGVAGERGSLAVHLVARVRSGEIGRASCRERVLGAVGGVRVKENVGQRGGQCEGRRGGAVNAGAAVLGGAVKG